MTDDLLLQHLSACVRAGGFAGEGRWDKYRAAIEVSNEAWRQMTLAERIAANDLFDEVERLIDEKLRESNGR